MSSPPLLLGVDLREQISLARGRCISPTSPSGFTPPSGGGSFSDGEKLLLTTDLLVVRSGRCGADKVGGWCWEGRYGGSKPSSKHHAAPGPQQTHGNVFLSRYHRGHFLICTAHTPNALFKEPTRSPNNTPPQHSLVAVSSWICAYSPYRRKPVEVSLCGFMSLRAPHINESFVDAK